MQPNQYPKNEQGEPYWESLTPCRWYARHGHRCLDFLLLVALLPLALPLMVVIGLGNWMVFRDPRQVFFLQPRVGWKGETFRIVKFRTMKATRLTSLGSWSGGEDRLRVTALGKFLRNAHLDELPQLFNILLGQMSFIGPRPEMVEIETWASEEIPGFSERLAIRPGLAGLAQITQGYTGHDVAAYSRKLDINLAYMDDMSLSLDLRIIVGTAIWMVRGKGWQWNQGVAVAVEDTPAFGASIPHEISRVRPSQPQAVRSGPRADRSHEKAATRT